MDISNIKITDEFKTAFDMLEKSSGHIFLTGEAGTGKSTLLEYFRSKTGKELIVLAPTGVAAVNVRGETIHSFFQFSPGIEPENITKKIWDKNKRTLIENLDAIVIDEISMVRADLLDCIDKSLRLNRPKKFSGLPFGGVQMIFIGDLFQLPPVLTKNEEEIFKSKYKSPYFFDSRVFLDLEFNYISLKEVHRQKDEDFISILNKIRHGAVDEYDLELLNERVDEYLNYLEDYYIYLSTTNYIADKVNQAKLAELEGDTYKFEGELLGKFSENQTPADVEINLKPGAQIMLLNNDSEGRWINGTIGKLEDVYERKPGQQVLVATLENGESVEIDKFTWNKYKFDINPLTNEVKEEVIGSFSQFPVRLAWGITIHKSQGKTFEHVVIDIGRGTFVPGQLYVALSRCTNLNGIILRRRIEPEHIWTDDRLKQFVDYLDQKLTEE
ncbi:AAA family ATPase [Candidatus Dojkabacteria bacterium]|uniref:AAA family ATPase n=1 Tax=Candidatus Dojkabacteria bacterium TaxID=2099670 RepID=A0A955L496_9BACT|nr:AAA family ATPase [Candidatus Dojkabacteria bacterium]